MSTRGGSQEIVELADGLSLSDRKNSGRRLSQSSAQIRNCGPTSAVALTRRTKAPSVPLWFFTPRTSFSASNLTIGADFLNHPTRGLPKNASRLLLSTKNESKISCNVMSMANPASTMLPLPLAAARLNHLKTWWPRAWGPKIRLSAMTCSKAHTPPLSRLKIRYASILVPRPNDMIAAKSDMLRGRTNIRQSGFSAARS